MMGMMGMSMMRSSIRGGRNENDVSSFLDPIPMTDDEKKRAKKRVADMHEEYKKSSKTPKALTIDHYQTALQKCKTIIADNRSTQVLVDHHVFIIQYQLDRAKSKLPNDPKV
jgi:hypothetical protein